MGERLFEYKQRPQTNAFRKGHDNIRWDSGKKKEEKSVQSDFFDMIEGGELGKTGQQSH